jgi:hypothetical protein
MSTWHERNLGDLVAALRPSKAIMDAFQPAFDAAGRPLDMAVFSRDDLIFGIATVIFSPRAIALAKQFGARPCDKPQWGGDLSLLVGDKRALEIHYPESRLVWQRADHT